MPVLYIYITFYSLDTVLFLFGISVLSTTLAPSFHHETTSRCVFCSLSHQRESPVIFKLWPIFLLLFLMSTFHAIWRLDAGRIAVGFELIYARLNRKIKPVSWRPGWFLGSPCVWTLFVALIMSVALQKPKSSPIPHRRPLGRTFVCICPPVSRLPEASEELVYIRFRGVSVSPEPGDSRHVSFHRRLVPLRSWPWRLLPSRL